VAVDRRDRRQYTTLARSIRSSRAASSLVYAHVRSHAHAHVSQSFSVYIVYIYIYSTRHGRHRAPRPPTGGSSTSVVVNAPLPSPERRRSACEDDRSATRRRRRPGAVSVPSVCDRPPLPTVPYRCWSVNRRCGRASVLAHTARDNRVQRSRAPPQAVPSQ